METIYLQPKDIPAKLRGNYSGRKFKARVTDKPVTLRGTYWDGGSRSTWVIVNLTTGARSVATGKALNPPQFGGAQSPIKAEIPPNCAIVEHSIFQGKDMGLTFYLRPDNAAALIPAPVELSDHERAVLEYTRSRKASYNGQDRYAMYLSEYRKPWKEDRHQADPMTREQWQATQAALAARKLLNKAGAITPAGRNAIGNSRKFCS